MSSLKDPQQLSKWLADAISVEISKPEDDIDMDFVDECQSLINILINAPEYTDEETETRFNRIITKVTEREHKIKPKNRFRFRFKSVLVASIIIFIFFGFSVGLFAFNPSVRNMVFSFFEAGQTIEGDGITYLYLGENKIYENIESLIESEGLDIKFPTILPEGIQVKKIHKPEAGDRTTFFFSDDKTFLTINHNSPEDPSTYDYNETYGNKYTFFLVMKGGLYIAYANIEGDLYSIIGGSRDSLISFINCYDYEE